MRFVWINREDAREAAAGVNESKTIVHTPTHLTPMIILQYVIYNHRETAKCKTHYNLLVVRLISYYVESYLNFVTISQKYP